jgi:hypothetical protein
MKKVKSAFILLLVITPVTIFTMNFKPADTDTPAHYYGKYHTIPITDISPNGWLKELLQRQRNGLGLHHAESGYPYNTCLWAGQIPKGGNPSGQSWWPYEQSGYLVDGLYRCGLALNDTGLINHLNME